MFHALLRWIAALCLCLPLAASDAPRSLDRFEDLSPWKAVPSDGVSLELGRAQGRGGRGLALRFDFHGKGGYAAISRPLPLVLPANYELAFWIRGECLPNNLEFKLVDASGENVWWVAKRLYDFPLRWTRVVLKKRHVSFAWGPLGGGEPRNLAALELAITAGKGGRGLVELDDLTLRELPPDRPYDRVPLASASSSLAGREPVLDAQGRCGWRTGEAGGWFQADFQVSRSFGGLRLHWDGIPPARVRILGSEDGASWTTLRDITGAQSPVTAVALPEAEARYLRVERLAGVGTSAGTGAGWGLQALDVLPLEAGATPNAFQSAQARSAPRGDYPRGFLGEQTYWTIAGVDGGPDTGLLGEDGTVEAWRGGPSVEPFLWSGGRLSTWSDATCTQSLEKGYLPIPTATRTQALTQGDLTLGVTLLGAGTRKAPVLLARYRLANKGRAPWKGSLFLAVRPYQVNPPLQFLGTPGGVSEIRTLAFKHRTVSVNGRPLLVAETVPDGFGAATSDMGPLAGYLRRGCTPDAPAVEDPVGLASGALRYDLALAPGEVRDLVLAFPHDAAFDGGLPTFAAVFPEVVRAWERKLGAVALDLPDTAAANTLRTCLAHILLSRNGPALQPGTRSYARSWIRDGAMMAAGLLSLGQDAAVREFIEWYAPNLFPDGKVPCVVDERGPDPVPENDSHGQFIYLVGEYYRFTGDRAFLARHWPQARKAAGYLESLIARTSTPEFQTGDKLVFRGLVPASISHEGYAAKPMHSYWDDAFTLLGLKQAAWLAGEMGDAALQARYAALRDAFRRDFLASMRLSMARHSIDYLPGCAELGDFDATSTTVGIAPGGELEALPRPAVEATFERFYRQVVARHQGQGQGKASVYTPYETRCLGTFVHLGWTGRAHELLQYYLEDLRPRAWNQWPEVVQPDPRAPIFLGDLPHAWVGSDYIRSLLSFLVLERGDALVVGAGLDEAWLRSPRGVAVSGLRRPGGDLGFRAKAEGRKVTYHLEGSLTIPPGGLVVAWPLPGTFSRVSIDGAPAAGRGGREVLIARLPATVVMER
ncbi:MAG: discoidin domain-containing protein [Acidobacteria bacterium]|nr:discoidin domain-containing protein [Acidobacteriota bacterium]